MAAMTFTMQQFEAVADQLPPDAEITYTVIGVVVAVDDADAGTLADLAAGVGAQVPGG